MLENISAPAKSASTAWTWFHRMPHLLPGVGLAMVSLWSPIRAQEFEWRTFAGSASGPGFQDGLLADTHFSGIYGVAADPAGNLFVTDSSNHTIRKISTNGVSSTLAGTPGKPGSDDGLGDEASFYGPAGIAIDPAGFLLVADSGNQLIRRISPTGEVATVAGQPGLTGSTDGPGASARFNYPQGIALDRDGAIFVTDTYNHTIRKISPDGEVSTIAGKAGEMGSADGTAGNARFASPIGLVFTADGFLHVADTGNCTLRRISPQGVVTTTAGQAGNFAFADGVGTAALFADPTGMTLDADGNLIVTDPSNCLLRRVTPAGVVTTLAGTLGIEGLINGLPGVARFSYPQGIAFNPVTGLIAVADIGNEALRTVTAAGLTATLAGGPREQEATEGVGTAARFRSPAAITALPDGSFAVADTDNRTVRKLTATGQSSLLAGRTGVSGAADGDFATATFGRPMGVAADSIGNVYIGDGANKVIRKITLTSGVSTVAGMPETVALADRFMSAGGVAADGFGNVYCTDHNQMRRVTPDGTLQRVAGRVRHVRFIPPNTYLWMWSPINTTQDPDGTGLEAVIGYARGPSCDAAGNVYFADADHHTIRRCTPEGAVTTLAGKPREAGSTDGTGAAARFFRPSGVVVAPDGTLYVADEGNHLIRRVSPAGVVTTIGGRVGYAGTGHGIGNQAAFASPGGLTLDPATGDVLVVDTANHRIVRGVAANAPQLVVEASDGRHLLDDEATEDFGPIAPGARSAERTLVLHNVGNQPLEVQSAALEFGELSGFQVEALGAPSTVAPNASLTLHISLTPPSLGDQLARLVIRSNDPAHPAFALDLTGRGNSTPVFAGFSASTLAGRAIALEIAKLLAKATDADADDSLTLTGVDSASLLGAAIRIENSAVVYTPGPAVAGADSFFITIRDTRGSEVKGRVDMKIIANSNANDTLQTNPPVMTRSADGQVSLSFRGIPGRSYLIQRSTDLQRWVTVATVTASEIGTIEWQDPTPPQPTSYYRLGRP